MTRSRIGFLASGAGGNPNGIGGYVQTLNNEGIPAVIFCNDGMVGIADAIASGGNHVLLYRIVKDGTEQWSVPDYNMLPKDAAAKHWNKLKPQFHPDFVTHKSRIWLQPINEVDKNRSDWLGNFALEFAKMANWEGYKVAMFAFSSGEPEPEHWRTAGMVGYLNYCATHKEMAAVATHEYDYGQAGMSNVYPWHIGRFQELYKACDEMGIKRPYVLISEFGWSYDSIPTVDKCLEDIDFAAELYAKYADVLGAVIWYLGPGFNNIANAAQKLIVPVTNYTINTEFPEPEEPGEPPMPDPLPYTVVVNLLPQDAEKWEKQWVLDQVHTSKETILQSADDAARLVAPGKPPNSRVKVWGVERWTDDIVQWLHNKGVANVEVLALPTDSPFGFGR